MIHFSVKWPPVDTGTSRVAVALWRALPSLFPINNCTHFHKKTHHVLRYMLMWLCQ